MGTFFFIGKSGCQSWDCSFDFDGMAVDNRGDSIVGIDVSQKNQTPILEKSSLALSGDCLLYTSPSPRDSYVSRMPSSA